jgi:chromosome segregation ATPase
MLVPGIHVNAERNRRLLGHSFWILAGLLFLGYSAVLKADTLTLKSGDVVEGQIISETETQIEIEASLYHGTIFSRRQIDKSDIQSIVRESLEQKQEKETLAALTKFTLNPNQELTKDQYAAGIAAFEKFQAKFTNSTATAEINQRLVDWRAEATNVASGKVKFASTWMTPEEKKTQAERAEKQTAVQTSQEALQSLKTQLTDLQVQRAQLDATITTTQAKLMVAQAKLSTLPDTSGAASGSAAGSGGGRRDLAGRLTAGISTPHPEEAEAGPSPAPNPEKGQLQGDITLYQQQMSQEQATLASLDAKIKDIQTQIPQREQDSKLALARLSESSAQAGTTANTPAKDKHPSPPPPPPPPPEPTPPWYMRVWNYFHQ